MLQEFDVLLYHCVFQLVLSLLFFYTTVYFSWYQTCCFSIPLCISVGTKLVVFLYHCVFQLVHNLLFFYTTVYFSWYQTCCFSIPLYISAGTKLVVFLYHCVFQLVQNLLFFYTTVYFSWYQTCYFLYHCVFQLVHNLLFCYIIVLQCIPCYSNVFFKAYGPCCLEIKLIMSGNMNVDFRLCMVLFTRALH